MAEVQERAFMKTVSYSRRGVLKAKRKKRQELARLPFAEKVTIVKKLKKTAEKARKAMKAAQVSQNKAKKGN